MNRDEWIRQIHRWLSITFTLAVIVNIVAFSQEEPAIWVGLLALLPLILLLFTGLYLFVQPYAAKSRAARTDSDSSSEEVPINRVRRTHRWLSIAFTAAFILNIIYIVAFGPEEPSVWVGLLALLPLILLLFTGLYLFVQPYAAKSRGIK